MRKGKILKTIIVLIMGIILFAMSTNVFALSDSDSGIDLFDNQTSNTNTFEDQSNLLDLNTNTNTNTNTNASTNTNINTSNNTNTNVTTNTTKTNVNNYNTNLPKAGAPENTMMGVAITSLVIIAIYAYKKVREYKNI